MLVGAANIVTIIDLMSIASRLKANAFNRRDSFKEFSVLNMKQLDPILWNEVTCVGWGLSQSMSPTWRDAAIHYIGNIRTQCKQAAKTIGLQVSDDMRERHFEKTVYLPFSFCDNKSDKIFFQ